tara:strand:+ start:288 stop:1001 length:714 start_codon:yes stop_codon:yes gene_type:complete
MEAATKWTKDKLDGVHLVLCDNADYLFMNRDEWEHQHGYEFDKSELAEYVNEWQDAVLRELDKLGTVEVTPDEPAHLYRARMSERLDAAIALLEKERALGRDLDPVLQKAGYRDHQERIDALNADRESFCEPHRLPEYITDHITVESERYSGYWCGYNQCGYKAGFGATVYRSAAQRHGHPAVTAPWKYQNQYGPELERLIDAISEATSNAHDWIVQRIVRAINPEVNEWTTMKVNA